MGDGDVAQGDTSRATPRGSEDILAAVDGDNAMKAATDSTRAFAAI